MTTTSSLQKTICSKCSTPLPIEAQFCPSCGKRAGNGAKFQLTLPTIFSFVFLAGIAAAGTHFLGASLAGKMPTETEDSVQDQDEPGAAGMDSAEPQEITTLRENIQKDPNNIELKKSLAQSLFDSIGETPNPQKRAMEILTITGQVLQAAPNDPQALLLMANLSFDQQVFDKSQKYYVKYLSIKPDDFEARASYGSSLTFTQSYEEAVKELDKVLKTHPDYFQALAYKTIALSEQGKKDEAMKVGKTALQHAPSAEAKQRFGSFLDNLNNQAPAGKQPAEAGASNAAQPAAAQDGADAVTAVVKASPVAGPRYASSQKKADGTLEISMKEFPMDKMPPMAMDAFFGKLKVAAQTDKTIKKIVFIDAASGSVMKSLDGPF